MNGTAHKLKANVAAQSTKITSFMCESREYDVINAEVMFTNFIIEHNLPIAASDHAGAIFKKMYILMASGPLDGCFCHVVR